MACLKARKSEVKNPATGDFFCLSYSSNQKSGWRHMQTFHATNNPLQDWKLKPKATGIQDRYRNDPPKIRSSPACASLRQEVHPVHLPRWSKTLVFMDFTNPSKSTPPGSTSNNSEARCPAGRSHNPFQMATWKQSTIGMQRHKLHMVTLLVSSTFPNLWIPDLEVVTLWFI